MCHCASVLDTYALSMVQSSLISRPEKKEEKENFSGLGTRERAKIEAKIKRVDKSPGSWILQSPLLPSLCTGPGQP